MNPKPPNAGKGRPKGAVNKTTAEAREFAENFISRPDYVRSLQRRVDAGKAPHMETLLWHYAKGKPKETNEFTGNLVIRWQS